MGQLPGRQAKLIATARKNTQNQVMKNPHAQALGRLGKGKTSEAKAAAARRNGTAPVKEGSKPRGRPRKSNGQSAGTAD